MKNIIKIIIIAIITITIYNNNLCVEIENKPQNDNSESQKNSWQAFEEERKKINSIIDMTDLQKEYNETSEKLRQIKHETNTIQITEEEILRLEIREKFLKEAINYAQNKSENYSHNLSAMMHGLDNEALRYNCYSLKKYNYDQCSRIRDQEYHAVKTMILASSQKNNITIEPMSKSVAQKRYVAAKTKIDNLYKKEDDEYLASLSPEEAERAKRADFVINGCHCKIGDYNNHETFFYNPRFMIEYSKESPYENDILATMSELNQALFKKYQNPELKEKYDSYYDHMIDFHSIIGLKINTIINMQHISNLRLIKEWEVARIQCDKTKKELDYAIENLMETDKGKQYRNALQEYIIQKNNLIEELKNEDSRSDCTFVTNSNRTICESIEETRFALEAKALPREPLALKGINDNVQNKFNNARENYYLATEMLMTTEQYRNNFAPTEKAYYYWKYKAKGLRIIATKNSCAVRTKYIKTPKFMQELRYYGPINTIKRMKNALIKKMYPWDLYPREEWSNQEIRDECTRSPLCYKMRERVVIELLSIIEAMRIEAGLKRKEEEEKDTFYKFNVDKKSEFEHYKTKNRIFKTSKKTSNE